MYTESFTMSSDVSDVRVTLSVNISNVTDPPGEETGNGIEHHAATIVILVLFFVTAALISLFGNMLVCVVIHRSKRLQSTTNYFVISLAVTDIIYTCFIVPFQVTELIQNGWYISLSVCKLVRFLQYWLPSTVMFVLLCVCEDRYYTILYPLSFKITRGRAKHMIGASWFTSFIVACPALYFYDLDSINDVEYCASVVFDAGAKVQGVFYITCYLLLTFAVPIAIISAAYVKIFRYIWRTGIGGRTFQRTTNPVPRPKVKMVKMIMAVNIVIVVLASPFVAMQLWFYSLPGNSTVTSHDVFLAVTVVYFICSVAKPVLYMCYNSNFRRGCKEVFCMNAMKCYRANVYTITTTSKLAKTNHIGIGQDSNNMYRANSPSKTFNRAGRLQGALWPLDHTVPSTYV